MTDNNTDPTTDDAIDEQSNPTPAEAVDDQSPEIDDTDDGRKGNSEAAKWRVKYREQEAANAALTARVAALQADQVTRMATGPGKLHDGSDLLANIDLEHLLDESGDVDQEKVTDALDELFERKPHLKRPVFSGDVGQGQRGDSTGSASWHDVIAG